MKKAKFLILIISYLVISCDDQTLSREDILTQSWILEESTLNGVENYLEAIYYKNSTYTFFQDETLQIVISQSQDIVNGTWQLYDNDSKLKINFSGSMYEYDIEKINENDLWLSIKDSDDEYLYKFSKLLLE